MNGAPTTATAGAGETPALPADGERLEDLVAGEQALVGWG
jgi:hypothetical protein